MNVIFPGCEIQEASWSSSSAMLCVLGGLLGFFRYKRWL